MPESEEADKKIKSAAAKRCRNYQATFDTDSGREILKDLAQFCYASKSTFHRDEGVMRHREGRREVFLRIQQHMKVTEDDIWNLFNNDNLAKSEE